MTTPRPTFLILVCLTLFLTVLATARDAAAHNLAAPRIEGIAPASGRAGDEVTIKGKGFGFLLVRVFVGGIRARVISANSQTIRFRVPAGVRPGARKVTIKSLLHVPAQVGFTVLAPPLSVKLDSANAETATIPVGGGAVTTTGSNGVAYTLTIPEGALTEATAITITPVRTITNFYLKGGILAAVRLQPEGTQFRQPATLTMTLPGAPAPALVARGLIGFAMQDDGSGFEPVPFNRNESTVTLAVPHFTVQGVAGGVCSTAIVTSTVGRDACDDMNNALNFAAQLISSDEIEDQPLPVRIQLASEINAALSKWLAQGIQPAFEAAIDPAATATEVDEDFDEAFREFLEIRAIIALVDTLGVGDALAEPVAKAEALVPQALLARQSVANVLCLEDRPNYMTHVERVIALANSLDLYGIPVDGSTRGLTCVIMKREVTYPDIIPAGGATLDASANLIFADGGPLPATEPPPRVRVTLLPGVLAVANDPIVAEDAYQASLVTTVSASLDNPDQVSFTLEFLAPRVGLRFEEKVFRCRAGSSIPTPAGRAAPDAAGKSGIQQLALLDDSEPQCAGLKVLSGALTNILVVSAAGQTTNPRADQPIPADASGTFTQNIPRQSVITAEAAAGAHASATETITHEADQGLTVTSIIAGGYSVTFTNPDSHPAGVGNAQGVASLSFQLLAPYAYTLSLLTGFSDPGHIVRTTGQIVQSGAVVRALSTDGSVSGVLEPGTYAVVNACAGTTRNGPGDMRCEVTLSLTPQ